MDEELAAEIFSELNMTYAFLTTVRSASVAGPFSSMPGTIVYETPHMKIPVLDLFSITSEDLTAEMISSSRKLISMRNRLMVLLHDVESIASMVTEILEQPTERLQFLSVVTKFLQKLMPSVEVNACNYSTATISAYSVPCSRAYLGMGTILTWHGSPDARTDWVPVTHWKRQSIESSSSSSDSLGSKTVVEAKKYLQPLHKDQLLAQAVVSSYIHKNRHPDQNPCTPALALSTVDGKMMSFFYDCENDLLLEIGPLRWIDISKSKLVPYAVVLIWLILNHRYFLKPLTEARLHICLPKSNLQYLFRTAKALDLYENLKDYSICNWPARTWDSDAKPPVDIVRRPPKRRRESESPEPDASIEATSSQLACKRQL